MTGTARVIALFFGNWCGLRCVRRRHFGKICRVERWLNRECR